MVELSQVGMLLRTVVASGADNVVPMLSALGQGLLYALPEFRGVRRRGPDADAGGDVGLRLRFGG